MCWSVFWWWISVNYFDVVVKCFGCVGLVREWLYESGVFLFCMVIVFVMGLDEVGIIVVFDW